MHSATGHSDEFRELYGKLAELEAKLRQHIITDNIIKQTLIEYAEKVQARQTHNALWADQDKIRDKYKAKISETLEYNLKRKARGRIRIARIPHYKDLGLPLPLIYGFTNVLVGHTRVKKSLTFLDPINVANEVAPDVLRDVRGRLYVNLVAFARCFARINAQTQQCGWTWSTAYHVDETGNPTDDYRRWRAMGSSRSFAIPTPEGYSSMGPVLPDRYVWPAALMTDITKIDNPAIDYYNGERTGMIMVSPGWPAYAKIEFTLYKHMVQKTDAYRKLAQMVDSGHNLLLISQNAPEILMSANGKAASPFDQIIPGMCGENGAGTLEINEANVKALKRLELDHMGHAYSLAIALLHGESWL